MIIPAILRANLLCCLNGEGGRAEERVGGKRGSHSVTIRICAHFSGYFFHSFVLILGTIFINFCLIASLIFTILV